MKHLKFDIEGTPKPVDLTGSWNEESYVNAVIRQIDIVNKSYTGGLVIGALNGEIDIRPEPSVSTLETCAYHHASRTLNYTPGLRIKGNPLYLELRHISFIQRVGAEADNTLVHELWHAQRASNGFATFDLSFVDDIDHLPWLNLDHLENATDAEIRADPDFQDRFLEFNKHGDVSSILVENIYASEKHPGGSYLSGPQRGMWYPIRADHESYRALRDPGALSKRRVIKQEIASLLEQQENLVMRLAMAPGDFNPFHEFIDALGKPKSG
ncbi:MAG: hypothetical protein ABI972_27430 [Acidobacteriota bacterium]